MPPKPVPIYSSRDDDRELRESISDFVVSLAERIDTLQDAENDGNFSQLRALGELLAEDSVRLGYAPLADLARRICVACEQDKPEVAQKALLELTDIGRRIRLGHRGAS